MRQIEDFISPLVREQFPEFYKEEGEMFIAFVEAYYEWAENNLQQLSFNNDTGFSVGDTITQGEKTGTIISNFQQYYIVQLDQEELFRCNTLCNDLTPVVSSSGSITYIATARQMNHEYMARNLPNYRDIDNTIDKFIIEFKNKYLPDIQFNTQSNKRLFIKNALDFYRAKGTPRAVDLFFKLIYGIEADTYYPADDVFKLSDNEFIDVQYLELVTSQSNIQLVGKTVKGVDSNAQAFVDRLIRVKKGSRYVEVVYLANVFGDFQTGEQITTVGSDVTYNSKILGSFSSANVVSSDAQFLVGDLLSVVDGEGKKGKVRVTNTKDLNGVVDFEFLDGGWGYSTGVEIISSDSVLGLNDLVIENESWYDNTGVFKQFETVKQDLVSLRFDTDQSNTDVYTIPSTVSAYVNDSLAYEATLVFANTLSGEYVLNFNSDVISDDSIIEATDELYLDSNSSSIQISNVSIINATANVIGTSLTSRINYSFEGNEEVKILQRGDIIYQTNPRGVEFSTAVVTFSDYSIVDDDYNVNIRRELGNFRTNLPFRRKVDDQEYTINSYSNTTVGIFDIQNQFYENANTYGLESGTHSPSRNFGFEVEASISLKGITNVSEYENYYSNQTIESANLDLTIDSSSYGFAGNTQLGFNDVIEQSIGYEDLEIGQIAGINILSIGDLYSASPFFIIHDPKSYHLERYDYQLVYEEPDSFFVVDEIVVGSTSGATGVVTRNEIFNRTLSIKRTNVAPDYSVNDDFIPGETITGLSTNISATVSKSRERRNEPRSGLNAIVTSDSLSDTGFIDEVAVIDSGFGYFEGEELLARSVREPDKYSVLEVSLGKQGIAPGYFTSRKGNLSSDKFLHDNDFYQEYSYQVLTALPFDVYKQTLIDVFHVAGTKPFGKYFGTTVEKLDLTITSQTSGFFVEDILVYENDNTFFNHRISTTLRPLLFEQNNVFYSATAITDLIIDGGDAPETEFADGILDGGAAIIEATTLLESFTGSDVNASDKFGTSVDIGENMIVVGAPSADGISAGTGAVYVFDLDANETTKIYADDGVNVDSFGISVAVGSGRIVVGAYADDDGGSLSGSVYIFDLDGNQLSKITASDAAAADYFGRSVAVGSNRIVVGANGNDISIGTAFSADNTGSVYIFDLDGNEITKITASDIDQNDNFGQSVAIVDNRIIVGSRQGGSVDQGAVYVYDLDGNEITIITSSDGSVADQFGQSVAAGSGRIVVGAPLDDANGISDSGSVYIFNLDGDELAKISANDGTISAYFGESVAIDSEIIVVGAPNDEENGLLSGSVYIFNLDGDLLTKISDSAIADNFGAAVAVGSNKIVIGIPNDDSNGNNSGSVNLYELTTEQTIDASA